MKPIKALPLILSLVLISCGDNEAYLDEGDSHYGPHGKAVVAGARSAGIPERVFLAAAYTQSNFGTSQNTSLNSSRNPILGFAASPDDVKSKNELKSASLALAKKVKEHRSGRVMRDDLDWLIATAIAMVGDGYTEVDNADARERAVRLVLSELVRTYNNGFTTMLPQGEVLSVKMASPKNLIDVNGIDPARRSYFRGYLSLGPDFDATQQLAGIAEKQVVVGNRTQAPNIVIRWCPASALQCYDYLRQSTEAPAHLLWFKSSNSRGEMVQFYNLKKDLYWYGAPASNTISIVIAGLAGDNPENFSPDWLDWEDYANIRYTTRGLLESSAKAKIDSSQYYLDHTFEANSSVGVPEGRPNFALPVFWDKPLFNEMLVSDSIESSSKVQILRPITGSIVSGQKVKVGIAPSLDAFQVEVYQDSQSPVFGNSWDLIKKDYPRGNQVLEFFQSFVTTGASRNKSRAIKVVARDLNGKLIGTRVSKFIVGGIQTK